MTPEILNAVQQALDSGNRGVLCTVIEKNGSTPCNTGSKMWVNWKGDSLGTVGGGSVEHRIIAEAMELLSGSGSSCLVREDFSGLSGSGDTSLCGGSISVFLEVLGRKDEIVIFGAGHVGKAIAQAGELCGFPVCVWDDREEYANPQNIPEARTICCPLADTMEFMELHGGSYVVVCTRGHSLDGDVLELVKDFDTAYVGLLASSRKIAELRKKLVTAGVSEEFLNSIHTPVGLPINADSPREIAVSVLAEIIAVKNGVDPDSLRCRSGK